MSVIKPFKSLYYNIKKVKDFKKVVAPPYDVISEEEQTRLNNLSPYNFTNIDFNKEKKSDDKTNNKYTRAKKTFTDWIEKEVMVQDEKPCLYFYKQEYKVVGQKYARLGFVSLMQLADPEDSKVHPHENTHSKAVDDRLMLTKALSSNLSCIFVCYSDKDKKAEKIFNKYVVTQEPLISVVDDLGIKNQLWRLDDPDLIKDIDKSVEGENLFIADGHHRYKVAQEYRRQKAQRRTGLKGDEPFNYVMTYFTNIDSKGLQIFPMHRIVKSLPQKLDFLEEYFRIDKVKNKEDLSILIAKAGRNEHAFGLYSREGALLLRLKNRMIIEKHVKEGSKEYRKLDATILKNLIFDKVGVISDDIMYTSDIKEVLQKVDKKEAECGFIMNPVKIAQLKSIALNGETMPPKTTYFYPKVLSGLTVYKMD